MTRFLQQLTTDQGRITTGCALVVAIIVGLWPDHPREIDAAKFGAALMAALAWLFAELGGRRTPSPHDTALFDSIVKTLPQSLLDFLREQDFGVGSYHDPASAALFNMARWEGSRYNFVDPTLNKRWLATWQVIREFATCLARNTFPVRDTDLQDWRTVHPTHGDPEMLEPFVEERIEKLNKGATKAVLEIDAFESFARRRLGL